MKNEFHDLIIMRDDDGYTYISGWCKKNEIKQAVEEYYDGDAVEIVSISDIQNVYLRSVPQFEESADGCKWPILTFFPAVPHTRGARKITICRLETK